MSNVLDRFLRYVKIDTQSEFGKSEFPSTQKQLDLSRLLVDELNAMGAKNVVLDKDGYVYAEIEKNTDSDFVLGFIAHVDTSDAVSGKDVNPQIHKNYQGGELKLNGATISPKEFPTLLNHIGKTLVTADGTTLLGADDKAGVAEIMQMAETLLSDNSIKHGTIKIAFTPDEEVGRGADFFDVAGFACHGAYTVDGGEIGELQFENFNAAAVEMEFFGRSVHPGDAKNKMINALLLVNEFVSMLPANSRPDTTEVYEGFFHLDDLSGGVESAKASLIIRDHDKAKFEAKKQFLQSCVDFINKKYLPQTGFDVIKCDISDSYYNMKEQILPHMHLVENAKLAMEKADVEPLVVPIRGGTDGARLSYLGLPCPNLFTGGYNFHGKYEYIPAEDMEKAVEVLLNIVELYSKKI